MSKSTKLMGTMEFVDISSEKWREYVYNDGTSLKIENVKWLFVKPKNSHRLLDGDGVSHWINMEGVRAIRWQSDEHFVF